MYDFLLGAQWLSGRVLDLRPRGCGFEPHRRHNVVVLDQDTFILTSLVQPRKTRPCLTERLVMVCKESNQTKQTSMISCWMSVHYYCFISVYFCFNGCVLIIT